MPESIDALLLYGNPYYNVRQHPPFGLDSLASFLSSRGLDARVLFPFLYERSLDDVASEWRARYEPKAIGVNIRNIDPYIPVDPMGQAYGPHVQSRWFLPQVQELVAALRRAFPGTPIVLGGTGYSTSPAHIARYVECPAGVVGAGESALLSFVTAARAGGAGLESSFGIRQGDIVRSGPAVRFSPAFRHSILFHGVPVRTKIGCNRACSYCTDPVIDGYDVVTLTGTMERQLAAVREQYPTASRVFITDSEFNLPLSWAESVAQSILESDLCRSFQYATQVLPKPFRRETMKLLAAAGFTHLLVTADGFSDPVHSRNRKSYRTRDIVEFLDLCQEFEIAPVIQNIFGLPGETAESLRETLRALRRRVETDPRTSIEFTLGGRVYPGTHLEKIARAEPAHVYGEWSEGLLKPLFYCSPYPPAELNRIVSDELEMYLPSEPAVKESVSHWRTALLYYADSSDWERAAGLLARVPPDLAASGLAQEALDSIEYALERGGRDLTPLLERALAASGTPEVREALGTYATAQRAAG